MITSPPIRRIRRGAARFTSHTRLGRFLFSLANRGERRWKALPGRARFAASSLSGALVIALVLLTILQGSGAGTAFASGVYTSTSTDADGNTQLAANSVKATTYYDTTQDSTADSQLQLGVDPNWKNGIDRKSYAMQVVTGGSGVASGGNPTNLAFGSSDITADIWLKTTTSTGAGINPMLLQKGDATSGFTLFLGSSSSVNICFGITVASSPVNTCGNAASSYADGKWHLISGVRKGTKAAVYFDGAFVAQGNVSNGSITSSQNFKVAQSTSGFNGTVDEVRMSGVARYTPGISFSPSRHFVEDANTLGLWHFDDGTGTSVADSSLYGNALTISGTALPTWVTGANALLDGFAGCSPDGPASGCYSSGLTGAGNISLDSISSTATKKSYEVQVAPSNAVTFDGSNDYVSVTDSPSLDLTGSFTIEAWVRLTSTAGSQNIISKRAAAASTNGYVLRVSGGQVIGIVLGAASSTTVTGTAVLSAATWYHLAAVYNGSSISVYINGVMDATAATAVVPAVGTDNLYISSSAGGSAFNGRIDEVRISNTARYGTAPFTPSRRFSADGATAGLWHLDEGSGTGTTDSSGNGNTGTFMNGASNSPAADGSASGPIWTTGVSASANQPSSSSWLFPGYQFRKRVSVTAASGSGIGAGYGVETTENRGTYLDNGQTQAGGNDWKVAYQPSNALSSLGFASTQKVTIPYGPQLDLTSTSQLSVSLWFKTSSTADQQLFSRYSDSTHFVYLFGSGGNSIRLRLHDGTTQYNATLAINYATSQWIHVVGVVDKQNAATGLKLYVNNGAPATASISGAADISSASATVVLGQAPNGVAGNSDTEDEIRIYNRALTASDVASLYAGGSGQAGQGVTNGLVVGYHADEGSGQTLVDFSGNGNNGLLGATVSSESTDPSWVTTDGVGSTAQEVPRTIPNGNSVSLDGTNDYATASGSGLGLTGSFTAEAWVKTSVSNSGADGIISNSSACSSTGAGYYVIRKSGTNKIRAGFYDGSSVDHGVDSLSDISLTAWNNIAVSYDYLTGRISLFLNGRLDNSAKVTVGTAVRSATALCVGANGSSYLNGQISEVRVSNVARYRSNYTSVTSPWANDASTVGLWRLAEGSGTTLADSSSQGDTLTFKNGASNSPAADGSANGPIWARNQGAIASLTQTDFRTVAPIASTATDSSYYLYFGKADEAGAAASYSAGSLTFNGTSSYVNAPTSSTLTAHQASSSSSISAWINPQTPSDPNGRIVDMSTVALYYSGSKISYSHAFSTTTGVWQTTSTISAGWHNLVVTYDASSTSNNPVIYIDGSSVAVTNTTPPVGTASTTSSAVVIGNSIGGSRRFKGQLDDVRLYNRILSSAEAVSLATNTPSVGANSLAAWWKFDDASSVTGTSAADSSPNGNTATLNGFTYDQNSGWTVNANTLHAGTEPTVATAVSEQEAPAFFKWRDISSTGTAGSWSASQQISGSRVQLGSTGVYLRFNELGAYSLNDDFLVQSWAIEAFSSSRGKARGFPLKANVVASTGGLDVLDATTNKLWMRFSLASSALLGASTPTGTAARNGHVYMTSPSGLYDLDFSTGISNRSISSGTAPYGGNMSARGDALGYGTAAGAALVSSTVNGVAVATQTLTAGAIAQNVAVATSSGLTLLQSSTGTPVAWNYSRTSGVAYASVALTTGGALYGANTTSGGVDRYDAVQNDSASQTTSADVSYTTSSTPALANGTINKISVSEGTSPSDYVSNSVALATAGGTEVIQENATTANGYVEHYVRTGSVGTSKWSSRGFGNALSFNGTSQYVSVPDSTSLALPTSNTTFTLEGWVYYAGSTSSDSTIVSKTGASDFAYAFVICGTGGVNCAVGDAGKLALLWSYNGTNYATTIGTSAVPATTWTHVAVSRNGTTVRFFINGALDATVTVNNGALFASASPVRIGAHKAGASVIGFFSGRIDDVRISNTTRYVTSFTLPVSGLTRDAATLGLWHMDERTGQSVFDDSGNQNDGTLGATSSASTDDPLRISPAIAGTVDKVTSVGLVKSSDPGNDLLFTSASSQFVGLGSATSDNPTYTLSLWAKGSGGNIFQRGDSTTCAYNPLLQFNIVQESGCASLNRLTDNGTFNDSKWHQFVFTRNGTAEALYVDGSLNVTATRSASSPSFASGVLTFGRGFASPSTGSNYLNGSMDDVRMYTRAITGAEVATLYNGGMGRTDNPLSGIGDWWKMNESAGQSVTDSAGSITGTLGATSSASTDDPTWSTGSAVRQQGSLWMATNDTGSKDGAVTDISLSTGRQVTSFSTGIASDLAADATSISVGVGGLALVGSDNGAWSPAEAGSPTDDTLLSSADGLAAVDIKGGTVRVKGGTVRVSGH